MKLHHRSRLHQISQKMWIMFLYQLHDYRTGGRNHHTQLFLFWKKSPILRCHQTCALSRICHICKSQFLHCFSDFIDSSYPEPRQICRMKRGNNLRFIFHCTANRRDHILFFLGILRTDKNTFLTINTLTLDNSRLMIMDSNRLDRAVSDTFIAVLTTDFLKLKD